ncbi:MAG: 2-hydroxycyclohexanecarboxyl-CoA dehydrogenase, partial [Gammaproteobacteria bacterium]
MANTQQIALVTGGARGIGEAICRVLAKAGHRIIVTDISVQGAQDLAKQLDGHAYEMDVTNAESVNNAAEKINQEVGVPTILVNNAGWDNLMPFL